MPANKKPSKKNSTPSTRPKSRSGSSNLNRSTRSSFFTKKRAMIVAALAALGGLAFVAFSQASSVSSSVAAAKKLPVYGTGYKVSSWNCKKPDDTISYGIRVEAYGAGQRYRCVFDPWGPSYWTRRVSYLVCNNSKVYKPYDLSSKWTTCRNRYR